jgi:enoyl-CoA hydratase
MDSGTHQTLRIENRGAVRIFLLDRGKANTLEPGLVRALHDAALAAEDDGAVRGVVLTSASSKVFCGGFDLATLGTTDRDTFGQFIRAFESLFYDLFLYRKPLVAALPGHTVAGGALLAGTADFRYAAEGTGTIGLPEASLGVHVPHHFLEALRATVGDHALTRWSLSGGTVSFPEAFALGAIDRILPPSALLDAAVVFAEELGKSPSDVYASIKRDLRATAYEKARDVLEESRKVFVDSWFSEAGQKGIATTLAHLRRH